MLGISKEIEREVGILVNRRGNIERVIVGERRGIRIPEIVKETGTRSKFSGLRFIHTHLDGELLSKEDLNTLALERLDLVVCITEKKGSESEILHAGYLIPNAKTGKIFDFIGPSPQDEIELDFLEFITELENEFLKAEGVARPVRTQLETCVIVSIAIPKFKKDIEEHLSEMKSLCEAAGLTVLDTFIQKPRKIHPGYIVGKGKMEEIIMRSTSMGADMLVFDEELSPVQLKNISALTDLKVIDRNQLILDIFATKAKTKEAKIQVELAQLRYIFPRLSEKNTAFSRLTGGIGGRGPGETKLEIDRRRIRDRIVLLERKLEEIKRVRETKRVRRMESPIPSISIVGYANSGKSSLLNLLTKSKVDVDRRPFSTLSPTTRTVKYPERKNIIISDTVGLIRNLPETLFDAFLSTFEELKYSDLLIHLVDISDEDVEEKISSVEKILERLGLKEKKRLIVFNKIDKLSDLHKDYLKNMEKRYNAISISCMDQTNIDILVKRIEELLLNENHHIRYRDPS
ncbi:MAG: GTPase HflX [Desulfobacterota bacterium]|nr:GTPase HflX [Thermodesulfobacteriota bacterium]MDW8001186.1 GTPase HflX [Deltaproteobacteria bacterium]